MNVYSSWVAANSDALLAACPSNDYIEWNFPSTHSPKIGNTKTVYKQQAAYTDL